MDIEDEKRRYDTDQQAKNIDKKIYQKELDVADKYTLDHTDRMLLRHLIHYPNAKPTELGRLVGMSRAQVRRRQDRPVFMAALRDVTADTAELIPVLKREAAQELRKLVKQGSEATRARVALAALEAELAPKQGAAIQQNVVFTTSIDEAGVITQSMAPKPAIEAPADKPDQKIDSE